MKFCAGLFIGGLLATLAVIWLFWVTVDLDFSFGWGYSDPGRSIKAAQYPAHPLWSPDGAHIAFNADAALHFIDASGVRLRSISFPIDERNAKSLNHAMDVSPEGIVAFAHNKSSLLEVKTASFDGQELNQITKDFSFNAVQPIWSPDGSKLALFLTVSFELAIIEIESLTYEFVFSSAGRPFSTRLIPPEWSPDGHALAFVAADEDTQMIYTVNTDGTNLRCLSETAARPAWSPDGERIAFARSTNNILSIHTIKPDGTGLEEIASFPGILPERIGPTVGWHAPWGSLSWSEDGSTIRGHQNPFVEVAADGSKLRIMDTEPGALAGWSPNGDRIAAYLPDSLTGVRLFTMNANGSDKRVLVERNTSNDRNAVGVPWIAAKAKPLPDGFGGFVWTEVSQ